LQPLATRDDLSNPSQHGPTLRFRTLCSVAALLVATEAMVAELPKEPAPPMPGGGGMGGMGF